MHSGTKNHARQARERLLDSAEKLFAQKGYAATSIRDITADAGCNTAAVNYHFGGKEKLYQEVYLRRFGELRDMRIARVRAVMEEGGREPVLEDVIRAYANAFLEPLVDESHGRRLMYLMNWEMLDPHLPLGMFIRETIRPVMEALRQAVQAACPMLAEEAADLCIFSLVGQLAQAVQIQSCRRRETVEIDENLPPAMVDLPRVVEHIVSFTAAGLRPRRHGGED